MTVPLTQTAWEKNRLVFLARDNNLSMGVLPLGEVVQVLDAFRVQTLGCSSGRIENSSAGSPLGKQVPSGKGVVGTFREAGGVRKGLVGNDTEIAAVLTKAGNREPSGTPTGTDKLGSGVTGAERR